jgi:hypothetical protein
MTTHNRARFLAAAIFLLLPLQTFAVSASAITYTRYTNDKYGVTFLRPKDWSVNEYPAAESFTVHFSSSTYLPRLTLVTSRLERTDATIDQITDESLETLKSNHPYFKVKESYDVTVAGLPAKRLTISDTNEQGVEVSSAQVITKKDGRAYVFMLTDDRNNFSDNLFIFEKMLGSVTLESRSAFTQHFKSPAFNFEFDYPEGWEYNQFFATSVSEGVIRPAPVGMLSNVALIQRKLKKQVTQDDLEQEFKSHTSGTDLTVSHEPLLKSDFKLNAKTSATGKDGSLQLIAGYQGRASANAPLTIVAYLSIGKGNYVYVFKYWATEGDSSIYKDTQPAIIESVNFTDDQPKQQWTPPQSFTDVPVSHPYFGSISYMRQMSWVGGYEDGTYKPENHINRAEFTKILINALFPQDIDPEPAACIESNSNVAFLFSDVDLRSWFSGSICTAKMKGLVQGYPDGKFHPERDISFAEAAKIVALAFHASAQSDAVWYKPYVNFLADKKAIPTSIASFDAKLTRGEMAELIYRVRTGAEGNSLSFEQLQSR